MAQFLLKIPAPQPWLRPGANLIDAIYRNCPKFASFPPIMNSDGSSVAAEANKAKKIAASFIVPASSRLEMKLKIFSLSDLIKNEFLIANPRRKSE